VGGVGALDEAVQQNDHFIELEGVLCHDRHEVINSILKEEKFGALRVSVEEAVSNHAKGLDHKREKVDLAGRLRALSGPFARHHSVDVAEGGAKEGHQVWQILHTLGENTNDLISMLLHANEDIDNQLVGDVIEPLIEVTNTALGVLLEDLELRVLLV